MIHTSQAFLPTNAQLPLRFERLKEKHRLAELGERYGSAAVRTAVISMTSKVSLLLLDHVIWSPFNTLFMNFRCLGFITVYSVK
uniref:Uncharacterized protein n=1 Tax=Jaculus jaculus TaxID=51337 RepID=A0A8C5P0J5_JACJA